MSPELIPCRTKNCHGQGLRGFTCRCGARFEGEKELSRDGQKVTPMVEKPEKELKEQWKPAPDHPFRAFDISKKK